jgi:hypothetical protein
VGGVLRQSIRGYDGFFDQDTEADIVGYYLWAVNILRSILTPVCSQNLGTRKTVHLEG